MYCAPVLDRLGHGATLAVAVWEAVLGVVPGPDAGRRADPTGSASRGPGVPARARCRRAPRASGSWPPGSSPWPTSTLPCGLPSPTRAGTCRSRQLPRYRRRSRWRPGAALITASSGPSSCGWTTRGTGGRRVSGDPAARASQERLRRELLRISDQATDRGPRRARAAWGAAAVARSCRRASRRCPPAHGRMTWIPSCGWAASATWPTAARSGSATASTSMLRSPGSAPEQAAAS